MNREVFAIFRFLEQSVNTFNECITEEFRDLDDYEASYVVFAEMLEVNQNELIQFLQEGGIKFKKLPLLPLL